MKKQILVGAMTALALTAGPAVSAEAKGPKAKGKSERQALKQVKKCAKATSVGFDLRGTLAGYEAPNLALTVTKANKHARNWLKTNAATFDVTNVPFASEGLTDRDLNGVMTVDDVAPGDRVKVQGKLALPKRGCEADAALTLKRIKATREAPSEDEVVTEEPSSTPSA